MPEEAGLDTDFDRELAGIQGASAGLPAPVAVKVPVNGRVVTSGRTVELLGRQFRVADKVGLMPLLKFSAFADVNVGDPRALGAMYAMLRDCIHQGNPGCGTCAFCAPERCGECRSCLAAQDGDDNGGWPCTVNRPDPSGCRDYDPGDWHEFESWACEAKAEADDLMDVVTRAIELIAGRPTAPPSGSSPTRQSTRAASTARSSARRRAGSRR